MYRLEDKDEIVHCKVVLGPESLLRSVHCRGSINTANLTQDKFLASSEVIDSHFFERDSRAELKNQYREYVRQMHDLASSKPEFLKS